MHGWVIKSPWVTGDLLFLVRFRRRRRRRRRRRSANTFQLSGKNPEASFFKPHMVDLWVWEKIVTPIFDLEFSRDRGDLRCRRFRRLV